MARPRTSLRAILGLAGIPMPVIGAFCGRVSMGMTPLGMVLLVRAHEGSYGTAGICTASFAAATALGSPVRGRLVDRRGHTVVLLACGVLYSAALALMVLAATAGSGGGAVALAGAAALAGITYPPLSAALLALWAEALADRERIQTAYAFDAACAEGGFLVGTLLVALVAGQASADAAIAVASAFGLVGTFLFALSWRSRHWTPQPPPPIPTSALGATGVKSVLAQALAVGLGLGAFEIAVPAFAEQHGALDRSGLFLALYAVGSVTGGLWLGTRPAAVGDGLVRRYLVLLAGGAVAAAMFPLVGGQVAMVPVLLVNGFMLAPVVATMYLLLERLAPVENRTEAFAWLNTATFSGAAAGSAIAGALTQGHGPRAAMVGYAVAAIAAVAGALATRSALLGTPSPARAQDAHDQPCVSPTIVQDTPPS